MPTPESARTFFLPPMSLFRKSISFFASGVPFAELDAGVDVLGVLAEDHHVELLRMLHRAGHAAVVLHRADAGVEIERLAQRDVQASGCRHRPAW